MRKRYFTLTQANALIPRLRPRIERMMQLSAHLRTSADGGKTPVPPGTPWLADPVVAAWKAPDLEKARLLTASLYGTLSQELKQLESFGVEVKDLSAGLLGFPSFLEGRSEVVLCWRLGESRIRFFHALTGNDRARKSVDGHTFHSELTPTGQLHE